MNRRLFTFLLLIFIIFLAWYYFLYLPRFEKTGILKLSSEYENAHHVLYGYPIAAGARIIEYEGFVSGYDTVRLNPLWVSYNLKSQYVTGKKHLKTRKFSPDPTLAKTHTALDRDFRNSGFDRGHLARQSDMKGRSAECETEALYFTNISPQKQNFNRKTWNNLEMAVDRLAEHFGQAWIITGPYFDDDRLFINERVEIPDGFYKIVVLESERGLYPIAFVLDMDDTGMDIEQYAVTVDSIENLTKINFFHELDDEIEADFESQLFPVPYQWKK